MPSASERIAREVNKGLRRKVRSANFRSAKISLMEANTAARRLGYTITRPRGDACLQRAVDQLLFVAILSIQPALAAIVGGNGVMDHGKFETVEGIVVGADVECLVR